MDIDDIQLLVNDADSSTSITREEASDMLVFGRISQYEGGGEYDNGLKYKGQFDLIKPKRNKIMSESMANPVSVSFKPRDGADLDSADVLNGLFRKTMQSGEEAYETAIMDQIDCGYGAFRFSTEYSSKNDTMDNNQDIVMLPINEANNRVYWDSSCKRKDKSDARWCCIVSTFTKNGWEVYCKENDINHKENDTPAPFKSPESSGSMFFSSKKDEIKIGEFYSKKKVRVRVFIYESPLGDIRTYKQKEVKDHEEELDDLGFEKVGERYVDRFEVTKYLCDGESIIKKSRIAGEYIPVVPFFGDWSYVEGREIWRGIYHDAQDAQRLHNWLMSYTADIVSQGPRQKPIVYPGQIKGFEFMWQENGSDNNYPYLLQNEISETTKQPYPQGAIGYTQPPEIPQAQAQLMQTVRQAVDDVTGSSLNTDQMLNSQVTEGQIAAVQNSSNMETFLYQNSAAIAMKQAGRIFCSMAKEIMDVPRDIVIQSESGEEREVQVMDAIFDLDTGEEVVLNDLTKGSYDVYSDTGPNYSSQRDQAKSEMIEMFKATAGTEYGIYFLLSYVSMNEGPGFDDLRDFANKQLIMMGVKKPETDEEKAMIQEAQQAQQNQQDPNMVLAMAEQAKAQAMQMDSQVKVANAQVNEFKAETDRIKAVADINKAQAEIQKMGTEIKGNELDNVSKLAQAFMPNRPLQ